MLPTSWMNPFHPDEDGNTRFLQTTGHSFLEDSNIYSHYFENLEFHAQQL
jgi:hypothetical protein